MEPHKRKANLGTITIVDELRHAIETCGLTEYRIAKDAGIPQPVVNRFVRGERSISFETAAKLCAFLRLHLAKIRR